MGNTSISWTNKVWNPVTGCNKVSAGCINCYAETIAKRFWGERKFTDIQLHYDRLEQPLHWKKSAKIFVNSMSDLFHEKVSFDFIDEVMTTIEHCPQHIFQVLTKRPDRMLDYFNSTIEGTKAFNKLFPKTEPLFAFPDNIWLGTSIENQKAADERIPLLLQVPAKVRFLSVEPMLDDVQLKFIGCPECGHSENDWYPHYTICRHCKKEVKSPPDNLIDWVIVGCESGLDRRKCEIKWVESIVRQCLELNIPVFVKQMEINGRVETDVNKFPEHLRIQKFLK